MMKLIQNIKKYIKKFIEMLYLNGLKLGKLALLGLSIGQAYLNGLKVFDSNLKKGRFVKDLTLLAILPSKYTEEPEDFKKDSAFESYANFGEYSKYHHTPYYVEGPFFCHRPDVWFADPESHNNLTKGLSSDFHWEDIYIPPEANIMNKFKVQYSYVGRLEGSRESELKVITKTGDAFIYFNDEATLETPPPFGAWDDLVKFDLTPAVRTFESLENLEQPTTFMKVGWLVLFIDNTGDSVYGNLFDFLPEYFNSGLLTFESRSRIAWMPVRVWRCYNEKTTKVFSTQFIPMIYDADGDLLAADWPDYEHLVDYSSLDPNYYCTISMYTKEGYTYTSGYNDPELHELGLPSNPRLVKLPEFTMYTSDANDEGLTQELTYRWDTDKDMYEIIPEPNLTGDDLLFNIWFNCSSMPYEWDDDVKWRSLQYNQLPIGTRANRIIVKDWSTTLNTIMIGDEKVILVNPTNPTSLGTLTVTFKLNKLLFTVPFNTTITIPKKDGFVLELEYGLTIEVPITYDGASTSIPIKIYYSPNKAYNNLRITDFVQEGEKDYVPASGGTVTKGTVSYTYTDYDGSNKNESEVINITPVTFESLMDHETTEYTTLTITISLTKHTSTATYEATLKQGLNSVTRTLNCYFSDGTTFKSVDAGRSEVVVKCYEQLVYTSTYVKENVEITKELQVTSKDTPNPSSVCYLKSGTTDVFIVESRGTVEGEWREFNISIKNPEGGRTNSITIRQAENKIVTILSYSTPHVDFIPLDIPQQGTNDITQYWYPCGGYWEVTGIFSSGETGNGTSVIPGIIEDDYNFQYISIDPLEVDECLEKEDRDVPVNITYTLNGVLGSAHFVINLKGLGYILSFGKSAPYDVVITGTTEINPDATLTPMTPGSYRVTYKLDLYEYHDEDLYATHEVTSPNCTVTFNARTSVSTNYSTNRIKVHTVKVTVTDTDDSSLKGFGELDIYQKANTKVGDVFETNSSKTLNRTSYSGDRNSLTFQLSLTETYTTNLNWQYGGTLVLKTNNTRTAPISSATPSDSSWISYSISSGVCTVSLTLNGTNDRSGSITVKDSNNNTYTCTISQSGLSTYYEYSDLQVSFTYGTIPASGGTLTSYNLSVTQYRYEKRSDNNQTIATTTVSLSDISKSVVGGVSTNPGAWSYTYSRKVGSFTVNVTGLGSKTFSKVYHIYLDADSITYEGTKTVTGITLYSQEGSTGLNADGATLHLYITVSTSQYLEWASGDKGNYSDSERLYLSLDGIVLKPNWASWGSYSNGYTVLNISTNSTTDSRSTTLTADYLGYSDNLYISLKGQEGTIEWINLAPTNISISGISNIDAGGGTTVSSSNSLSYSYSQLAQKYVNGSAKQEFKDVLNCTASWSGDFNTSIGPNYSTSSKTVGYITLTLTDKTNGAYNTKLESITLNANTVSSQSEVRDGLTADPSSKTSISNKGGAFTLKLQESYHISYVWSKGTGSKTSSSETKTRYINFTASSSLSWITISGSGNSRIVTIAASTEAGDRPGSITLTPSSGSGSATCSVSLSGIGNNYTYGDASYSLTESSYVDVKNGGYANVTFSFSQVRYNNEVYDTTLTSPLKIVGGSITYSGSNISSSGYVTAKLNKENTSVLEVGTASVSFFDHKGNAYDLTCAVHMEADREDSSKTTTTITGYKATNNGVSVSGGSILADLYKVCNVTTYWYTGGIKSTNPGVEIPCPVNSATVSAGADWLTFNRKSGTSAFFTAAENKGTSSRRGAMKLYADSSNYAETSFTLEGSTIVSTYEKNGTITFNVDTSSISESGGVYLPNRVTGNPTMPYKETRTVNNGTPTTYTGTAYASDYEFSGSTVDSSGNVGANSSTSSVQVGIRAIFRLGSLTFYSDWKYITQNGVPTGGGTDTSYYSFKLFEGSTELTTGDSISWEKHTLTVKMYKDGTQTTMTSANVEYEASADLTPLSASISGGVLNITVPKNLDPGPKDINILIEGPNDGSNVWALTQR